MPDSVALSSIEDALAREVRATPALARAVGHGRPHVGRHRNGRPAHRLALVILGRWKVFWWRGAVGLALLEGSRPRLRAICQVTEAREPHWHTVR